MKLNTEQWTTINLALECEKHHPENSWAKTYHNDIISKCQEIIKQYHRGNK